MIEDSPLDTMTPSTPKVKDLKNVIAILTASTVPSELV